MRWLIFIFLIMHAGISYSEAPDSYISLNGFHKFHPGDDPQWSDPSYDDSHWQTIEVPASWESQGVRPKNGMGWYRIYFMLPESFKDRKLGISLGFIGSADEAFINGIKIGGEGAIGKRFIEASRIDRLYRISKEILKTDNRDNILSVRVMHTFGQGGIFKGSLSIGNYSDLLSDKLQNTFTINLMNIFVAAVLFIFIAYVLIIL